MKKLLIFTGIVVAVLVIAFVVLSFFLGNIVTAGVNRIAPKLTQTTVTLASASISPLNGTGTLQNLVVGNPKGWSSANLCSLERIHVDLAPSSLLGDHILINEIDIEAPEFNYETKIVASNVGDLLKNLEAALGGGKETSTTTTPSGKPIKIEVKKFRLKNGKVRVGAGPSAVILPMPPVEMNDLGTKEGGLTPNQLAVAVMKNVTPHIIGAATSAALDLSKTGGAGAVEGVRKLGESIFGGKK